MNTQLQNNIQSLDFAAISEERKEVLNDLIDYIKEKIEHQKPINFNFICTHNSRRSQFSQVWAFVLGHHYKLPINSYSGGVEITACNERTIASLKRMGFEITEQANGSNPIYTLHLENDSLELYSKLYDDPKNPQREFAAIMTCSSADEGCPFIPGAEKRLPIRYEDPKAFDDTELESKMYDKRSLTIASELNYVFVKALE